MLIFSIPFSKILWKHPGKILSLQGKYAPLSISLEETNLIKKIFLKKKNITKIRTFLKITNASIVQVGVSDIMKHIWWIQCNVTFHVAVND